ncbi:NADP-dependent oxidoreductase [Marisediminicola sp. LYQ134]|uniref:NADP-dependent oxidoreductase n=1 Tax=Marisediminicola sp. LYQ134 TaxID=3391061 RepID=UPI003982DF2F
MSRFVQYAVNGGPEVLELVDVPEPHAGPGEVRVAVRAAGLNPVDGKIRAGLLPWGPPLPGGTGNDFAGTVDEVGAGVTEWAVGDDVLGGARHRALADVVVIAANAIARKPVELSFEEAGSLDIAGRTAWKSVASLGLTPADTVLVSAAAGGVGVIAAQLVRATGATVIGTAGESNHDFLRGLGVIPVLYGEEQVERIRAAAPGGLTAVLDNSGDETVEAAIALGVPAGRINSIASHSAAQTYGVGTVGGGSGGAADIEVLAAVAHAVADGTVRIPIEARFDLEHAAEAYRRLETGHLRGKIVVVP